MRAELTADRAERESQGEICSNWREQSDERSFLAEGRFDEAILRLTKATTVVMRRVTSLQRRNPVAGDGERDEHEAAILEIIRRLKKVEAQVETLSGAVLRFL